MPWMTIGPYDRCKTYVDDEDVHLVEAHYWTATPHSIQRKDKERGTVRLHREIMNAPRGMDVDHIDGNIMNNSRSNLRVCTRGQNGKNIGRVGVCWVSRERKWAAYIRHDYVQKHIGYFDNYDEAVEAYKARAKELRGEFASRLTSGDENE